MSGYDDPRYLQTVIEKLKADVATLQRQTLPLLSYQRGPTPGWMNAGQIGPGPGMKSSMHLHLDGNQAGVAPRLSVTDPNGKVRFEAGNLASYSGPHTTSNSQYGFRVLNSNGDVMLESSSLVNLLTTVVGSNFTTSAGASAGTWSTANFNTFTGPITGTSFTIGPFTQGGVVLAVGTLIAKVTAGTGMAYALLGKDGLPGLSNVTSAWQNGGVYVPGIGFDIFPVSSGSHTFGWYGSTDANTITGSYTAQSIQLYAIGGALF